MSQQPPSDQNQQLNIDNASIEGSQIGQAGRDLTQNKLIKIVLVDLGDVSNLVNRFASRFLDRQASTIVEPSTPEYRQRRVLLNKVEKSWIGGVLKKSLHTKALIELGLEERLDAVERPYSSVQESPDEPGQALPKGTDITQVFNQMGEGKNLLILGEPGAGKTTILLKILQDLIAQIGENLQQLLIE